MSGAGRIGIVGSTTWGTTLGILLGGAGRDCTILCRNAEEADSLNAARSNARRLPGVGFPPSLSATADPAALRRLDLVILAVPSQAFRTTVRQLTGELARVPRLISATKGLEIASGRRMTEVLAEEAGAAVARRTAVLSGPNLAGEIAGGLPASAVVAAVDPTIAGEARALITTPRFRVYTQADVIGVEMGGSLKNVIALAAGACDGFGFGDNAKAAIVTRGLAEIARLGVAVGADPLTFAGLAGLGDLMATCASRLSRNHIVGERLARGESLDQILGTLGQVAEGVPTTRAACHLAAAHGVEMPIAEQLDAVLYGGKSPRQAVADLMNRAPTTEVRL